MKTVVALALLPLAGCVTERIPPDPMGPCRAEAVQVQFAGEKYRSAMREHIGRTANARTVRVTRPGEAVTMDFRPDRLTITLDENDRIAELRCG